MEEQVTHHISIEDCKLRLRETIQLQWILMPENSQVTSNRNGRCLFAVLRRRQREFPDIWEAQQDTRHNDGNYGTVVFSFECSHWVEGRQVPELRVETINRTETLSKVVCI